jgi:phosphatidylinositol kinase/protein kinase (PI-3  family)
LSEEFILSMMRSYCQVVEDNPQEYKKTMENIFEALKSQSVVLITNHETFANIPILVSQIHKYAEIHNMPEIRNQCNVIL